MIILSIYYKYFKRTEINSFNLVFNYNYFIINGKNIFKEI